MHKSAAPSDLPLLSGELYGYTGIVLFHSLFMCHLCLPVCILHLCISMCVCVWRACKCLCYCMILYLPLCQVVLCMCTHTHTHTHTHTQNYALKRFHSLFLCLHVKELARELHTRHFSSVNPSDSLVTSKLGCLVQDITTACQTHEQDIVSTRQLVALARDPF